MHIDFETYQLKKNGVTTLKKKKKKKPHKIPL